MCHWRYVRMTARTPTHKIIATEVVKADGGKYAVVFTYDDGMGETAMVGKQLTAEFYAKTQLGEVLPVGVNPLLLNAAKANGLRGNQDDRREEKRRQKISDQRTVEASQPVVATARAKASGQD
jgi:hypothetical protein